MAVGHVQNWTGVASTTGTGTITGTAVTAGNWMVAATRVGTGQTVTPPSPFTSVLSIDNSPGGTTVLEVFIGKAVGGETSFAFTETGTSMRVVLTEFSSILADSPLNVSALAETTSNTTCVTGTTGASAQADSMAIAFLATSGGSITAPSCSYQLDGSTTAPAFTLGAEATVGAIGLLLAWRVLSAIGTHAGTWSWTTARPTGSAIIVLKGLAPGGGGGGGVNGSAQWTEQERRRR